MTVTSGQSSLTQKYLNVRESLVNMKYLKCIQSKITDYA